MKQRKPASKKFSEVKGSTVQYSQLQHVKKHLMFFFSTQLKRVINKIIALISMSLSKVVFPIYF